MSTLSQLRTSVRSDIAQSDSATSDFSDSEINGFINQGQREIGAWVKKPTDHIEIQVEDNKEAYTLPSDAILLIDAYFGNNSIANDVIPLEILTEEALKAVNPVWLDKTTSSQGRPSRLILLDSQTVVLDPRPDTLSSASGKKLVLNYCFQPTDLSGDSDVSQVPIIFHDLIAKFAVSQCYMSAKMNKPDVGLALYKTLENRSKKIESLATREQLNAGFYWGSTIDEDDGLLGNYRL